MFISEHTRRWTQKSEVGVEIEICREDGTMFALSVPLLELELCMNYTLLAVSDNTFLL